MVLRSAYQQGPAPRSTSVAQGSWARCWVLRVTSCMLLGPVRHGNPRSGLGAGWRWSRGRWHRRAAQKAPGPAPAQGPRSPSLLGLALAWPAPVFFFSPPSAQKEAKPNWIVVSGHPGARSDQPRLAFPCLSFRACLVMKRKLSCTSAPPASQAAFSLALTHALLTSPTSSYVQVSSKARISAFPKLLLLEVDNTTTTKHRHNFTRIAYISTCAHQLASSGSLSSCSLASRAYASSSTNTRSDSRHQPPQCVSPSPCSQWPPRRWHRPCLTMAAPST